MLNSYQFSLLLVITTLSFICVSVAIAHGIDINTMQFLQTNPRAAIASFLYIGAKHMFGGYDHLLFLLGVIFFLFRTRDIIIYVSLFTLGHSLTLFLGVLAHLSVNAYLIDAVIGLSVVYKGFDNLGGFQRLFAKQVNPKIAVLIFGLFHGLGLATKLQDFDLPVQGLWKNLLAFNIGVEIGQFLALLLMLIVLNFWRRFNTYFSFVTLINTLLMTAGLVLFGYQIIGYLLFT